MLLDSVNWEKTDATGKSAIKSSDIRLNADNMDDASSFSQAPHSMAEKSLDVEILVTQSP
jgi:hypothetical protein